MAYRRQVLHLRWGALTAIESASSKAGASGLRSWSLWFPQSSSFAKKVSSSSAFQVAPVTKARQSPHSGWAYVRALLRDYKQLSKARLSALVVATSAAGYVAGSREVIDWKGFGWTCIGTMLASSSANALNQIYEIVNDSRMRRTAARPLPAGRMSRTHAAIFALATGIGGVYLLAEKTNSTTAALGAANIALYAAVYTPLKQISVANTWIGAVVGAVPPLMGWAAAAGELDIGAALLAAGLYFWQMPHFMALAWLCRADYVAGGYKMLSLVDPTGKRTAACALRNCAYLFPLGALAAWLGVTTPYFAYESAFITAGMLLTAAKFYSSPTNANARLLFRASLVHLPIFMVAFLLHRLPNTGLDRTELFAHNARLLGLGGAPTKVLNDGGSLAVPLHGESSTDLKARDFGRAIDRVSLPPLPFLPAPRLTTTINCPSKALCNDATDKERETVMGGPREDK